MKLRWHDPIWRRNVSLACAVAAAGLMIFALLHHAPVTASVNGILLGMQVTFLSWNDSLMKISRPLPDDPLPLGEDMLAQEIAALGGPTTIVASPSEDAAIIDAIQSGAIRYCPRDGYNNEKPHWISDRFYVTAGTFSDPDVRKCYRKYVKAKPIHEAILAQRKLLES